jgi:hypothetical protein
MSIEGKGKRRGRGGGRGRREKHEILDFHPKPTTQGACDEQKKKQSSSESSIPHTAFCTTISAASHVSSLSPPSESASLSSLSVSHFSSSVYFDLFGHVPEEQKSPVQRNGPFPSLLHTHTALNA